MLQRETVEAAVRTYAMVLQRVVRGVAGYSGKTPQTLSLGTPQEINRIVTVAERIDFRLKKGGKGK